jgi:hypothetical protein
MSFSHNTATDSAIVKLRDHSDVNYTISEAEKLLEGLNHFLCERDREESDEMGGLRFNFGVLCCNLM